MPDADIRVAQSYSKDFFSGVTTPRKAHRSLLPPLQIFCLINVGVVYITESKMAFRHGNGGTTRQRRGYLERTN